MVNGQPIEYPVDSSNVYRLPKQNSGNHTVVINAVDNAGNASTVSLEYTIQTINPPVITEYTKKVDFDTRFKVVGATYPQATVEVVLTDSDGGVSSTKVPSNEAGVFTLLWLKKTLTVLREKQIIVRYAIAVRHIHHTKRRQQRQSSTSVKEEVMHIILWKQCLLLELSHLMLRL
jgi:hypothetical protein